MPLPGIEEMARDDISVRISKKVYRLVKAVASFKGMTVADYLSQVVQPIAERDWKKINREVTREQEEENE